MSHHWEDNAACRNERDDLFFPPGIATRRNFMLAQEAIAICQVCPVQRECLHAALEVPNVCGIWGGVYLDSGSDRSSNNNRKIRAALEKL